MKRSHLVLLAITAILAVSSAYSLAAINQVYNVGFEWYSQYNRVFSAGQRDVSKDRCGQPLKKLELKVGIVDSYFALQDIKEGLPAVAGDINDESLADNIYVYCSLGETNSLEYRIKVVDIAQRGNNVEIKVSINTPANTGPDYSGENGAYAPFDIAKVSKAALPSRGRLYIVFKDQDGRQICDQYCYVA